MNNDSRSSVILFSVAIVFVVLTVVFARHLGRPALRPSIPLVDAQLLAPSTIRTSYVQLIRMKADLSDFDCYACHEKGKPPTLRFDDRQNIVVPKEHADVVMAHGSHGRNNNCLTGCSL